MLVVVVKRLSLDSESLPLSDKKLKRSPAERIGKNEHQTFGKSQRESRENFLVNSSNTNRHVKNINKRMVLEVCQKLSRDILTNKNFGTDIYTALHFPLCHRRINRSKI